MVEVSLKDLWYRDPPTFADQGQQYMAKKAAKAWDEVYRERNRAFAARDWEAEMREAEETAKRARAKL